MISENKKKRVVILCTHPVQYYTAWYRALAKQDWIDLEVWFGHKADAKDQADAGFGVPFEWDIPLLDGYRYRFLDNRALKPGVSGFWGTHSPEVGKLLDANPIDVLVVHGWGSRCYMQAIFAANKRKIPVFVRGDSQLGTKRNGIWKFTKILIYRWLMGRFSGFLPVGKRSKDYYLHYGANPNKIFPCPHFVDNDFFANEAQKWIPQRDALRQAWGIPKEAIVFVFVGKLVDRKKPMDFLKGLKNAREICAKNSDTSNADLWGLVVGDGPLRRQMEEYVVQAKIPVSFVGFLNQGEISKAYVSADCLVLPSDASETWGLVVNEAFVCGIPAIVSDAVGCAPDLIVEGETGWVFQIGDWNELTLRIVKCAKKISRRYDFKRAVQKNIQKYSILGSCANIKMAIYSVGNKRKASL